MGKVIGVLLIICGVLGGIALWLALLVTMSIIPFIEASTATPIDVSGIVWAVVWFFLSKIIGAVVGFIVGIAGAVIAGASD